MIDSPFCFMWWCFGNTDSHTILYYLKWGDERFCVCIIWCFVCAHMACFCVYVMHGIKTHASIFLLTWWSNHLFVSFNRQRRCHTQTRGIDWKGRATWKSVVLTENCDMLCRNMYISFHNWKKELKRLMIMWVCDQSDGEWECAWTCCNNKKKGKVEEEEIVVKIKDVCLCVCVLVWCLWEGKRMI